MITQRIMAFLLWLVFGFVMPVAGQGMSFCSVKGTCSAVVVSDDGGCCGEVLDDEACGAGDICAGEEILPCQWCQVQLHPEFNHVSPVVRSVEAPGEQNEKTAVRRPCVNRQIVPVRDDRLWCRPMEWRAMLAVWQV